jgi:hypothetical protein
MPDLQNFSITPRNAVNINVPRAEIQAQVTDSTTGAILADYTGNNSLMFPGVIATFTGAQQRELAEMLAMKIIFMKAGLE